MVLGSRMKRRRLVEDSNHARPILTRSHMRTLVFLLKEASVEVVTAPQTLMSSDHVLL